MSTISSPRRTRIAIAAALALTVPLAPVATAEQASPYSSDTARSAGLVETIGAPNPYVSFTPARDAVTWEERLRWDKELRAQAAARTANARDLPGRTVTVAEAEGPTTLGDNDVPADAESVPGFGTGSGDDPLATISGTTAVAATTAPTVAVPATEDDGDITRSTDTGLSLGEAITYDDAQIGDGPHGATGTGSGDFDVYAVTLAAGESLQAGVVGDGLDPMLYVYDAAGNEVAFNDDTFGLNPFVSHRATTGGTFHVVVAGFISRLVDPFDSSSGTGADDEGGYDITISRLLLDQDTFAVELVAGDVLGATLDTFDRTVTIIDADQTTTSIRSSFDLTGIYGAASPLAGGGAHAVLVAPDDGTYFVAVDGATGAYDLQLQAFRPGPERFRDGNQQTVFVDFDGATIPADEYFFGNPDASLSPLRDFLDGWGLTPSAEDAVIDATLAALVENLDGDLRAGLAGDRDASGVPGEFDISILNSRDHGDPFGQPNVSRLIIGGTVSELGVPTIGIAETIDPGNFTHDDTAVVLLDVLAEEGCAFGDSLNCFDEPGTTDKVELVGVGVGNIAAHELGHMLGSFHTDQFNALSAIMDQGGNLPALVGAGPDLTFGTPDDTDTDFEADVFVPTEGLTGIEDTVSLTTHALRTGTVTTNTAPVAAPDAFTFEEAGPLLVPGPGVLANDSDAEFDTLLTTLQTAPATGQVTLGGGGGFTFTPATTDDATFTYRVDDGDLDDTAVASITFPCASPGPDLANASFEDSDTALDDWCTRDSIQAPWAPYPVGVDVWDELQGLSTGFFLTEPTDGDLAAVTLWDGASGDDLRLSQFLTIAPNAADADLTFDWRAAWDMETFAACPCEDRVLRLDVLDVVTGEELSSSILQTAVGGTRNLDTGSRTASVDLAPFRGRSVEVRIVATVPDFLSGPGLLQVDDMAVDVTLDGVPVAVDDAYDVALGDTVSVPASSGVLGNDTDDGASAYTATLASGPQFGTVRLSPDGSFVYEHNGSAVLEDSFTYEASDAFSTTAGTVTITIGQDDTSRLFGETRIDTAVAISTSSFPDGDAGRAFGTAQASAVVLARADNFADGLAGTPFAASVDAPLLLTFPDALHPSAAAELRRVLAPGGTVHLLGGPVALSQSVADGVSDLGYQVDRIAGETRYDTAIAIASRLGDVDTILIARGDSFPDALSAGPAAIGSGGAIVLTTPETPNAATDRYLAAHPDATVFAAGGPAARAYPRATGFIGETRHETAILLADEFFDDPVVVGIARSDNFADALAGGVHIGRAGGPILLTPTADLNGAVDAWLASGADALRVAYAYGGPVALSEATVSSVDRRIS